MTADRLIAVALAVPLHERFEYRVPANLPLPAVGARVRVPFGRRRLIGVVLGAVANSRLAPGQLRDIDAVLDERPLLDAPLLALLEWAAGYYHTPIGEAVMQAVPSWLREGRELADLLPRVFALTSDGVAAHAAGSTGRRAPKQAAALERLAAGPCDAATLRAAGITADTLKRLQEKGLIEPFTPDSEPGATSDGASDDGTTGDGATGDGSDAVPAASTGSGTQNVANESDRPTLSDDQREVVTALREQPPGFHANLLYGVTGSGKTEVYLRLIEDTLARGEQALLLVPEIGLTPQLVARLRNRFAHSLAVLHSGLGNRERARAWQSVLSGQAGLVVGTRSAVFAPAPNLGLIVVDEEHDASFKQQTGFRYSARDVAIMRARRAGIAVILGSATPSLESLHNARSGRYGWFALPQRIGSGGQPHVRIIDLNAHAQRNGLATPLIEAIESHLERRRQVIVFINRRGFAPTLFCPQCATCERCSHCDANLNIHARSGRLRCHHCGATAQLAWRCPDCGGERVAVGAGTQRVEDELQSLFPEHALARLDRDAASSSDRIDAVLDAVASGETDLLVGTQMLTKGHDFARVTLVGILNADQGLLGTGFRGEERLAQTIIQVAGRAGRRDEPGELIVQTHFPQHPLLQHLLRDGYLAAADTLLDARRLAGWPPFSAVALVTAEAAARTAAHDFLLDVQRLCTPVIHAAKLLGPAAAAMERRQGRYRAQLLVQAGERRDLHAALERIAAAIASLQPPRSLRWAIDVDPLDV